MYLLYKKETVVGGFQYKRYRETCLLGCNNGEIPLALKRDLELRHSTDSDRLKWGPLDIPGAISARHATDDLALVINLKPEQNDPSKAASLYEVRQAWGISDHEWTAIFLHMNPLAADERLDGDFSSFTYHKAQTHEPVFLTSYTPNGWVENGRIVGKWTPPRNSVVLWPEALKYFHEKAMDVLAGKAVP